MNPGKEYAAMIREQNKSAQILPLCMAWEFMPRPIQRTVHYESETLNKLARTNRWQLPSVLRQLMGQPEWALIVTDPWQIIQYVNEPFELMTGYNRDEVIGWKPSFLQGAQTDVAARQRMKLAIEQEKPNKEMVLNYHKDGSTYWCDITIFPVRNDRQQLVNFIALEQEMVL
ncbi:PAS domain-containing protein [Spirosoma validum]|uniref:PAS domain-containing protein n=1 Tax=Spirosoma validum TaxID=2771355 RepID=A0A927B2Y1_9BACT|nr:PAS domain-containing protein [Spirosoma validum]MBD2754609.1 PAS domain-containing protein [Spirosoma validum]